jgi:hypothetical protein
MEDQHLIEVDGRFRGLGGKGIAEGVILRCFNRMRAWYQLACLQSEAEWADYDVVHAFSAFSLKPKLAPAAVEEHLNKLLTVFPAAGKSLPHRTVLRTAMSQFTDYAHYALKMRRSALSVTVCLSVFYRS